VFFGSTSSQYCVDDASVPTAAASATVAVAAAVAS
jgi:hypothetical protein